MRKNARERVVEGNLIDDSYFTIHTEKHHRSTKLRAKTYPWKSLVVIIDLRGYTIAEDNLQSFAEYLDTLRDTYASDKLHEYDESFVISRVIIPLKKVILVDLCRLIVMSMSTQSQISQTAGEQKYKRKVQ
ncbi:hypothetical protein K457DRAFT_122013 [Linnemannia elongata AG-77]|uniref:Uncharacterized protein n=1 Tax=Linnemannia elongata AG-77 TaxID=1314771 RepID=A0A197KCB7_9FUNG|nr:hypothetical protein K457DRAFT_122013 [Linnemannia elongata AG-77]